VQGTANPISVPLLTKPALFLFAIVLLGLASTRLRTSRRR
jgi:hypothetical protein